MLKLVILKLIASTHIMLMTFGISLYSLCELWRERWDCALCENTLLAIDRVTISLLSVHQAQRDIIFELRRIAFDAESDSNTAPGSGTEKRKAMYTKDYKMLGFTVCI